MPPVASHTVDVDACRGRRGPCAIPVGSLCATLSDSEAFMQPWKSVKAAFWEGTEAVTEVALRASQKHSLNKADRLPVVDFNYPIHVNYLRLCIV